MNEGLAALRESISELTLDVENLPDLTLNKTRLRTFSSRIWDIFLKICLYLK